MTKISKSLSLLLVVLMLLTAAPLSGFAGIELPDFGAVSAKAAENSYLTSGYCGDTADGGTEKDIYWELSDDGVLTVTGTGKIAPKAFNYDLRIKEVVISDDITNISNYCFNQCSNLVKVTMGNDVKSIDSHAFTYCDSLTDINFSEGLRVIGDYAFSYCDYLAEIIISDSLTTIGNFAFYYCGRLTNVSLPDSLTTIGDSAFYYCEHLTNISWPNSLTTIGDSAFFRCQRLTNVSLPDSLTTIGNSAFVRCYALTDISLPDTVTTVGSQAFQFCEKLKQVYVGESVNSLQVDVFNGCSTLENITVSEKNSKYSSVDGIVYNKEKTKLHIVPPAVSGEITMPASVEEFSYSAVNDCKKLTAIHVEAGSSYYKSVDGIVYSADGKTLIMCPRGKQGSINVAIGTVDINSSAFASCVGITNIILPEGLTTIGVNSFYNCDGITKIIVPEGVKIIGKAAFSTCDYLAEISLPSTLTTIEDSAFYDCKRITNVSLPDGLTTIGELAFFLCSLTDISLPDTVTTVGSKAFRYCRNLKQVYVGESVNSLPVDAFQDCSTLENITVSEKNSKYSSVDGIVYDKEKTRLLIVPNAVTGEITLPATLKDFYYEAFIYCYKLTAIHVEEGNLNYKSVDGIVYSANGKTLLICPNDKQGAVTVADGTEKISAYAFFNCSDVTNIFLPEGLTYIGSLAFQHCNSLTSIILPKGLTYIGFYAFYGCTSLTNVIFPEGLTTIGERAFYGCTSLTNITLPASLKFIQKDAFNNCTSLTTINIPKAITKINDSIFYNCGFTELTFPETVQSFNHTGWGKLKTFTIENRYCEYISTTAPKFHKDCVIRAYCGSHGHTLAVKRLLNFESIGHTYLDWYVYQPATFDAEGIMRRDCAYCDGYEERVIPKLENDVFTATFVANGEVVATVDFAKGTTEIAEPKVPAKDRYMGAWEEYTLSDADITINAVYTLIKSDDASEIETDSEVIHYTDKDDVLFKIKAWADALVVKSTVSKSVPLDIVLVVDQSGSMEDTLGGRTKKVDALKETAADFVNTVFENAKITEADHRISIVGFGLSGNYQGFEKNENTELLTSANGIVKFDDIKTTDYASSLLSVNIDGNVNDALLTAINAIDAKGATAADLGFEMAKGVFANTDSEGRQRVVIFMTDGEPTYLNGFQTSVANAAIYNASLLKSAYDASVYSVGVFSEADSRNRNINKFMNAVSSGYPDAMSMSYLGDGVDGQYYITVNNTDALTSVFKTISTESLSHTAPFDDITLIKTLSENVTMTTRQEEQLRIDVIRKYGITNNDIIITRNDDGTTTIQINGLTPYEVTDADGNVKYEVAIEFFASLNENASAAGEYIVDTDDSGVMLGSDAKGYEATFETSTINLTSKKTRVIFTINGEVYEVSEKLSNGYAVAPEIEVSEDWVFSGWDTGSKKATNGLVLDATITKAPRTITWCTADGDITQNYYKGDIITAPEVGMTADGRVFLSWDKSIPTTMPDENLIFIAVYGEHVHNYTSAVTKKMTCTEDGIRTFICFCGAVYDEVIAAIGHNYEAMTPSVDKEDAKCTFCCTNCGDKYDYALEYQVVQTTGKKTKVLYEFNLTDDELNTDMQPDGAIQIRIPLSELQGSAEKAIVYRYNEDGTKTQVPAVHEKGFLVITCDHFTPYEVIFDIPCCEHIQGEWVIEKEPTCTEEGYRYALCTECEKVAVEETIDKLSHSYTTEVTAPTCTGKGYTTYICTCGDSYVDNITGLADHTDGDGDEFCDYCDEFMGSAAENNCSHMCHKDGFMGFIWKIVKFFWKLFGMNPVCECGAAHY